MIWLILAAAAGLLAYMLVRTMRQYESESATAALDEVQRQSEVIADLERRIENLEAIVTTVDGKLIGDADVPEKDPAVGARSRLKN